MDFTPNELIVMGLLGVVVLFAVTIGTVIWAVKTPRTPHREVRIVVVNRLSGKKNELPWQPISHLPVVKDEIDTMRETNDRSCAFITEYR